MEHTVLLNQVVHYVNEYFETDVTNLAMDSRLTNAVPGLDSLKLFELILYLEDCFQVKFDETVTERLETVGDLVEYIHSLLPGSQSAKLN
jgi:acyl carrier protein